MFKDVGFERAILEKRARAGSPYKDGPGPPHQPPGTRSQSVPYFLMSHKIAVCHQYVLPDASFGASGKPDPKMIEYQGYQLYCHNTGCRCPVCKAAPEEWSAVMAELIGSAK
jgi:hypothetical protein